jgi:hypothetical protein
MSQINVDIVAPETGLDVTVDGNLVVTGINNIRPYKVYVALLGQNSPTSNPSVEVLENSLGVTLTWTRESTGTYLATASSPIFNLVKTAVFMQVSASLGGTYGTHLVASRNSDTEIFVLTQLNDDQSTPSDGLFGLTPIEIRVYS